MRILPTLLFSACCLVALGQLPQYQAQVFGAEYGIGITSIQDICQDKTGFLWLRANNQLQRFDGKTTRTYLLKVSLQNLICDTDNRIWTAGPYNIFRSTDQQSRFEPVPFDTSGGLRVRAVFQLVGQPVRLLTNQGFYDWREHEKRFVHRPETLPPANKELLGVLFDTCGTMLFWVSDGRVWSYDSGNGNSRSLPALNVTEVIAVTVTW